MIYCPKCESTTPDGDCFCEKEAIKDEMQDSFEVSALKDKNSMYQGDIKRLESENAALSQRLERFEAEVKRLNRELKMCNRSRKW